MFRTICTITVILAFLEGAYCQQPAEKVPPPTCSFSELYRKDGWVIPGLDGATKKERVAIPDRAGVYKTTLEPTKRASTIRVFRCSQEHGGRLEIEDISMGIEYLSSFDVGGRVFAYSLSYGVDGIAASWLVMFYDLDGSGRFTLRIGEGNRLIPPPVSAV